MFRVNVSVGRRLSVHISPFLVYPGRLFSSKTTGEVRSAPSRFNMNDSSGPPGDNNNDNDNASDKKRSAENSESPNNNKKKKKSWNNRKGNGRGKPENLHTWRANEKRGFTQGSYANAELREQLKIELPDHIVVDGDSLVFDPSVEPPSEGTSKRKLVFMMAYLGSNYSGFQMNNGQKTIQAEFELAMLRGKLLHPSNFGNPFKYGWSTSGRTDKGVHACAQVVSAKVEMKDSQTVDSVRDLLNEHLPGDVTVLDVARATRAFCAKTQRGRVRYQYMIPSFCLMDVSKMRDIFAKAGVHRDDAEQNLPTPDDIIKVQALVKTYRASSEETERLQKALSEYEGTHPYHNFSKGIKPDEARAKRFIESFRVEEPILYNDVEWIPTQVLGQSFLIHQIRKMICMAVDIARNGTPPETMSLALSDRILRLNVAPAQGLFLEMSYYGGYNRRKAQNGTTDAPDLDWHTPGTPVNKRWNEFRHDVIMQHIAEEEAQEGNFVMHLYHQDFVNDLEKYYSGKWTKVDGRAAKNQNDGSVEAE